MSFTSVLSVDVRRYLSMQVSLPDSTPFSASIPLAPPPEILSTKLDSAHYLCSHCIEGAQPTPHSATSTSTR